MSITTSALRRSRFTIVSAVLLFLSGLAVLVDFPATEEPFVEIRAATVEAYLPGATSARTEQALARPIEDKLREISEIKTIETVVRPGSAIFSVMLHGGTDSDRLPAIWQKLRNKLAEARQGLPAETSQYIINDEYARVAVHSLALTGKGYGAGQLQHWARTVRSRLQNVEGVDRISLHGVREERVLVEIAPSRLAEAGLSWDTIASQLNERNIVAPAGEIDVGQRLLSIEPTGNLRDDITLAAAPLSLPGGGVIPLGALGKITRGPADTPATAAIVNGEPAIVLGVSMRSGLNVLSFGRRLKAAISELSAELPAGMELTNITDQATVVAADLAKVGQTFLETVAVVMMVVVLFLGWRAGLVTGMIVPLTVMGTLVIMRAIGIELHMVSIAAVIISLGLFVDNGIVVVEDYQRRLTAGETPREAAIAAGETMAAPLLTSSLAIVIAFVPLAAGVNETAEYMRSLAIVMAVTLLLSLLLALTVTPLMAMRLTKAHEDGGDGHDGWMNRLRTWYEGKVRFVIARPAFVLLTMVELLALSLGLFERIPKQLLSESARPQLQMPIELAPGASTRTTCDIAIRISAKLADHRSYPEIESNVIYVNDGGPRFILGLNPPSPAPHRAYAIINLAKGADGSALLARLRGTLTETFPDVKVDPSRFSLGTSETGTAVFRIIGPDRAELERAAGFLRTGLVKIRGIGHVRDDGENRIPRIAVDVNQARAVSHSISLAEVCSSLDSTMSGLTVTVLRQGDSPVPVVLRAPAEDRMLPERIGNLPVFGKSASVMLHEVAEVSLADQPSVLLRRDQSPVITVSARGHGLTSQEIVALAGPTLDEIELQPGHRIELGGEIQENKEANAGIEAYLPLAVFGMAVIFLWQFGSTRKTLIIMASIPFIAIGASLGLWATGQPLSFTATLGMLALAGIIVNNAVLLVGRIQEELAEGRNLEDALTMAAQVRLRPIMMTKLTCIAGLLPLFIFGGALWRPMAAAMIGGLALGTLITLVLIPALYALLYRNSGKQRTD